MSTINFEHYKIFYYVAKLKNITAAANYLYLSQPSVSRCIKNLEQELECTLFTRTKKGVELTAGGELLYKHIAIACRHIFSAEEEISLIHDDESAILRLGGSAVALQSFLVEQIVQFHNNHPKVQIKIDSMSTPDAIEALKANLIDVAVVTSPFTDKESLSINVIRDLQDIACAGNEFAHLKGKEISLKQLAKYPLICLKPNTTTRHYLDHIFLQRGLLLRPAIELTSINLVSSFVKNNLGIGFLQRRMMQKDIDSGEIFEVKLSGTIPPRKICAVTCRKYPISPQVQRFIDTLLSMEDE